MQRRSVIRAIAVIAATALGLAAFAGPASASHFVDVPDGTFYTTAAEWMEEQGLTTGVGGTFDQPSPFFEPDTLIDRAQLATFLWRMAGSPPPTLDDDGFDDTADDAYYTDAVRWLRERGYTTGIGGTHLEASTTFGPEVPVDRAQAITFLWRYGGQPAGSPDGDPATYPAHEFEDVPPGTFYEAALRWAKAEGITTGYGGSHTTPAPNFEPAIELTRAEMAALVWRYAGFPDPSEPGNTQEGAWVAPEPTVPEMVTAAATGADEVTITYSEAVACDNTPDTAGQFTLTHGAADLTGDSIVCNDTVTVVLTLDAVIVPDAATLTYAEGADDDRIKSLEDVDALSPDSFEF